MKRFIIKLKQAHDKTGLSAYAVAKETGVAINTVEKYTSKDDVVAQVMPTTIIKLAEFYGYTWENIQEVVEVVEIEGDESAPEIKTPLPAAS